MLLNTVEKSEHFLNTPKRLCNMFVYILACYFFGGAQTQTQTQTRVGTLAGTRAGTTRRTWTGTVTRTI